MKREIRKILLYIGVAAVLAACTGDDTALRNGDLLFQVGAESPMHEAIRDATSDGSGLPFTHAAIVEVSGGHIGVIEAAGEGGVRRSTLDEFLSRSATVGGRPAVVVRRLTPEAASPREIDDAVKRAAGFIGQPYDYSFRPDNGRMYCSELVYESYRRADGSPIFTARPMNFRAPDGSMPAFWTRLFESLGEPIPEGVPGTNPADMAREPVSVPVKNYLNTAARQRQSSTDK